MKMRWRKTSAETLRRFWKGILAEYRPDSFAEEPPLHAAAKRALASLDDVDRNIMVMYSELMSERDLGKMLHISARRAGMEVARIRGLLKTKIAEELQDGV